MTEKLRLDIPILLPEVNTAADACVQILIEQIAGKEGVEDAACRRAWTANRRGFAYITILTSCRCRVSAT